jgi:hypothetical protein
MTAGTVDGSDLSKHLGFIMGGIKIKDKSAINPITKKPIYSNDGDPKNTTTQSRKMDFVLALYMGRETKKTFNYFQPMFQFLNDCGDAEKYLNHLPEGFKPLLSISASTATCPLLGRDSCLVVLQKYALFPATVVTSSCQKISMFQIIKKCEQWCAELHAEETEWKCYHQEMLSDEKVGQLNEGLAGLHSSLLEQTEKVKQSSKMRISDNIDEATTRSQKENQSIYFIPSNDTER